MIRLLTVLFIALAFVPPLHAGARDITGYGPFDFTRTSTTEEVERAGGSHLTAVEPGQTYTFHAYERFEGLVDFLEYHKKGKIAPACESGSVPKIADTELRLDHGKLWLVIISFHPNDYDDYLRVIKLEYGAPKIASKKKKGALRKDVWVQGNSCIVLHQIDPDNATGGQLEIQKGHCEEYLHPK